MLKRISRPSDSSGSRLAIALPIPPKGLSDSPIAALYQPGLLQLLQSVFMAPEQVVQITRLTSAPVGYKALVALPTGASGDCSASDHGLNRSKLLQSERGAQVAHSPTSINLFSLRLSSGFSTILRAFVSIQTASIAWMRFRSAGFSTSSLRTLAIASPAQSGDRASARHSPDVIEV